ncbi:MAG TPA: TetR/AcrR family transcriptional regulator [Herpetosiphonaceae bacterium]
MSRLFYERGYQAVGIDTIVAESGIAKMTLYRHFPSKDDLIVAYLERANAQFWGWLEAALAGIDDPQTRIIAMMAEIGRLAASPQCLGCAFQGAAAEFPQLEHRAHQAAQAHKQAMRAWLRDLAAAAGLRDPDGLANQLLLLIDGVWSSVRMFGAANLAGAAVPAAQSLLAAQQPGGAPPA